MIRRFKAASLRLQLSLWLLLPLTGLLGLDAWMTYDRAMSAAHTAFDRTLEASLRAMREALHLRDGQLHIDMPDLALEMLDTADDPHIYYVVRDANGATVTGYGTLPGPPGAAPALYRTVFYNAEFNGQPLRLAAQRLPVHDVGSARTQLAWVMIGETLEPRQALAADILRGALLQELMLVGLALLIVSVGVWRGLRPLHRLSAAVAARDAQQLAPIEQTGLPAEMRPLVGAMNQYLARLHRMVEARRRFIADAAHQLKTPLAVMQAQSELALREPDAGRMRERVRGMHDTVRDAAKGVQQLLSISRLESDSGYAPALTPLRLDTLAQGVALELAPVARAAQVDLGFEHDGAVDIHGQAELLHELVANLIDNAVRHCGAGTIATVRVTRVDGHPRLEVEDNGPGIAPSEREAVFDRFYRGESAHASEGSGLGLSIVREIARLHHATVTLNETKGGGLTVALLFPAGFRAS